MSAFSRDQRRFLCAGLGLSVAPDTQAQGKWPYLQNVRSYQQGTLQARPGLVSLITGLPASAHSLFKLYDPTSVPAFHDGIYIGTQDKLYHWPLGGPLTLKDSGYSTLPLCFVPLQAPNSPQAWLYIADSSRMRKASVDGTIYPIGIASPPQPPDLDLFTIGINEVSDFFGTTGWTSVGTAAGAVGGGHIRVNTTISEIYYDNGSSNSNVSIVPASMDQIGEGMIITLNGTDLVQVAEITIAIAPTTIASIIYDSGSTGMCTIQPAASLGTGQIFSPHQSLSTEAGGISSSSTTIQSIIDHTTPVETSGLPNPFLFDPSKPTRRIRQSDFPVNSIVTLGAETVRIMAVTTGPDGVQSFRCFTSSTHTIGQAITGKAAFRAWVPGTYTAGMTIEDRAIQIVITLPAPATTDAKAVATAGAESPTATYNLAQITVGGDTRAIIGEDDIHLALKVDKLTQVTAVRVYFDVDPSVNDFTQNYYFFEWHASDLITAIQSSNTATVEPVRDTVPFINHPTVLPVQTTPLPFGGSIEKGGTILQPPTPIVSSDPLGLGNNQWIDLTCKVSQLIHVGTETSKTLADVKKAEILVSCEGAEADVIIVQFDSLYISGGYGPDVTGQGTTYKYRYSYRSSITGARSNPSPETTYGVQAKRQLVILGPAASTDPQADLIDWWRFGGVLVRWTYVGTGPNTTADFNDTVGDSAIADGRNPNFDDYQPWPTTDLARRGTCIVAGSALQWVSGDHFNTSWAEGTSIIVNGHTYTLRQPPLSSTRILLNESAGGDGSTVAFSVPAATLMGQPLPGLFGGPVGGTVFTFGCGDPLNPGAVYWAKPNTPDMASDRNSLLVTPPSEPLQNGFFYDGLPYVFSIQDLYVLEPDFNAPNGFRALLTPCGKGLWTRWAFCLTPQGTVFLSGDGISLSKAGASAQSLTDPDLYPLFPHDGTPGVAVNGIQPPDMTAVDRLRLSYSDGWVYFDYKDLTAVDRTLAFRIDGASWWHDLSTPAVGLRFAEIGKESHEVLVAGRNTTVYTSGGALDGATPITCIARTVQDEGDARGQKLYRDLNVEGDLATGTNLGIDVTVFDVLGAVSQVLLSTSQAATSGRRPYYFDFDPTGMSGYGSRIQVQYTFTANSLTGPVPILYWYDIGFQMEPELATNWLSGPTTHGLPGFQQVPLVLMAYRSLGTVTFNVRIDNVLYAYSLPSTGGAYLKKFFRLQSVKGLTFQYGFQASPQAAFQLFDLDCEIWVQPWGYGGNYQKMKPFSGSAIGVAGAR